VLVLPPTLKSGSVRIVLNNKRCGQFNFSIGYLSQWQPISDGLIFIALTSNKREQAAKKE
jgi:hypothetical protein